MSIQITINANNVAESVQLVHDLASAMSGMNPADIPTKTEVSAGKPIKRETKKSKKEPEPIPDEQIEDTANDITNDGPIPTVVELRAKAQEVGKTPEAKKAIKALLNEFGSKSISDVPEDKRAEFMTKLEEL